MRKSLYLKLAMLLVKADVTREKIKKIYNKLTPFA